MRHDVQLSPWSIALTDTGDADDFRESLFFTGNGRMGVRGYLPFGQQERPAQTGLFVAGIYGEIKPGITDFVNLPTPIYADLQIDGVPAALCGAVTSTLDLQSGVRTQSFRMGNARDEVAVCHQVFCSLLDPSLLVQRFTLVPLASVHLSLSAGIHTACCNCPVPDDQVKENTETIQLSQPVAVLNDSGVLRCEFCMRGTSLTVREESRFSCAGLAADAVQPGAPVRCWSGEVVAEWPITLEIVTRILTSRDCDPAIGCDDAGASFDVLLAHSAQRWQQRWQSADIQIDGCDDDQCAVRYTIFQLIANCSAHDPTVSIGARGLTHTRYKGCYFWDTDVFMLPFYLYTDPQAAHSLEKYRLNTLPQAKAHARKMNNAGARYPWMASYDGTEQCESWDIGASEVHITADVVFAMQQYIEATDDAAFYQKAAEVYIETARFWQSRCTLHADGSADLLFCKGPDEYCGITSNNLYTNWMVKYNLTLAIRAARELRAEAPERFAALGLSDAEIESWQALHDALRLCRDPETGHYLPDETFRRLEPVDLRQLKADDSASYHQVCFDRLQRYQVIKQADTLLLMSRFPRQFTAQEKHDAWNDYEPLCLHDSTLSFASHALFAAQNGLPDAAEQYFQKALYLDLREVMGNTGKEGLHLANFGEVWSAIFFGFLGADLSGEVPTFSPRLLKQWNGLSLHFVWKKKRFQLEVKGQKAKLTDL